MSAALSAHQSPTLATMLRFTLSSRSLRAVDAANRTLFRIADTLNSPYSPSNDPISPRQTFPPSVPTHSLQETQEFAPKWRAPSAKKRFARTNRPTNSEKPRWKTHRAAFSTQHPKRKRLELRRSQESARVSRR